MELALLILKIKLKSLSTKLVIQIIFNNNTKAVLPSIYIRSSSHLQYNHSEYPKRRGKKETFPSTASLSRCSAQAPMTNNEHTDWLACYASSHIICLNIASFSNYLSMFAPFPFPGNSGMPGFLLPLHRWRR